MGESNPLDDAIASLLGYARAYHQRDIARRLHARADELAKAGRDVASNTLRAFACELEAELAPEVMADTTRAAEG